MLFPPFSLLIFFAALPISPPFAEFPIIDVTLPSYGVDLDVPLSIKFFLSVLAVDLTLL